MHSRAEQTIMHTSKEECSHIHGELTYLFKVLGHKLELISSASELLTVWLKILSFTEKNDEVV